MTNNKENITEKSKSDSKTSSYSIRSIAKAHLFQPKGEPQLMEIGSLRRNYLLLHNKMSGWKIPPRVNP
jgi:hypothetical protein